MLQKRFLVWLVALLPLLVFCSSREVTTIKSSPAALAPYGNFIQNTSANKFWTICPLGLERVGDQCTGFPELQTFSQAQSACKKLRDGNLKWRLPEIAELQSLRDPQLSAMTKSSKVSSLNQIFGYDRAEKFWSATTSYFLFKFMGETNYTVNFQSATQIAALEPESKLAVLCISP